MRVLAGVMFLCGLFAVASLEAAQPPGGGKGRQPGKGDDKKGDKGKGFPGGRGGGGFPGGGGFGGRFAPPEPGQVMPAFIGEMLKLTDDQKKQLDALQKDVDEKLAKILTDEQKKQLKDLKERGPGGFGRPGGPGGAGGFPGRPGGPGGAGGGGNPPPKPPVE
jgi:hypothetical protein